MWKKLRISFLLLILAGVAAQAWLDKKRFTHWQVPMDVGIVPIAGDDTKETRAYLDGLTRADLLPIESFFQHEALRLKQPFATPFKITLYPVTERAPPDIPIHIRTLSSMLWSLRIRYYAWSSFRDSMKSRPDIRLFVVYHNPTLSRSIPHSVGIEKGHIGLVHAFAAISENQRNQIVIAHELLHTVGATDKYEATSNAPRYPEGYAQPDQQPRYPQLTTELMAGRRALSETRAQMPTDLDYCLIGPRTAQEIHWSAD